MFHVKINVNPIQCNSVQFHDEPVEIKRKIC